MEYKHVDGTIYSRFAGTPPILNSELAFSIGLAVPLSIGPISESDFSVGKNVKLRIVIENSTKRMTCHARIDWVKRDEGSGTWSIGFGSLSLTDEEFAVLSRSFVERTPFPLQFGEGVRDKGKAADAVAISDTAREITRLKAVNLPVSVIELVDGHRGSATFSEFVVQAIRAYVKHRP